MEKYRIWKDGLGVLAKDLLDLAVEYEENDDIHSGSGPSWQRDTKEIMRQFREETLKVAVVGTIKSGKSTLVNAWLGGDILKRGAGVVTSIVTRVRRGEKLRAEVRFKGWDEVNADIEGSLALFPASGWRQVEARFDIRRDRDREDLRVALQTLGTDQLVTEDARNIHSVYLSSYLEGYDSVKAFITTDTPAAVFEESCFSDYQMFVADEVLAAYVRDILITVDDLSMPDGIELADCQGSDAPNPLHIAQVQDYLFQAHLVLYVISSRTGLRQADLRFLNMIRRMGILDSVVFVLNTDFGEHADEEDVLRVVEKVSSELGFLCPGVHLNVFSALYRLLKTLEGQGELPEKERLRLAQWEADPSMVKESIRAFEHFNASLSARMTHERAQLLLMNQAARLRQITASLINRCLVDCDLLGGDQEKAARILEEVRGRHRRVAQVQGLIRSTLDGASASLERELKTSLDRFFDSASGEVIPGILSFIRDYRPDMGNYAGILDSSGFSLALYHAFQDFRQALDTYMTDRVNPEIVRSVREMEVRMQEYYTEVARPYVSMVNDILEEYCAGLRGMGVPLDIPSSAKTPSIVLDPRSLAERMGLRLPPARAVTRYSARVRTEGHMAFGFQRLRRWLSIVFSKDRDAAKEGVTGKEGLKVLANSLKKIRKEADRQIVQHMVDYRENLKFQYVLRLSSALAGALQADLEARFSTCVGEMDILDQTAARRGASQEERLVLIAGLIEKSRELDVRLSAIQEAMVSDVPIMPVHG
ncbi:dynamin family protein [Desulfobotulus sp. H1]|uniref:Dynamin family protein n=1 Tax=Desulfobotulus pelophilus TaxID=2823377 RepID=A0ABT3NB83_9BACT|nr:dynamin family protein [Desulfobotulus pelophilus]MCW7754718.1 dynamin family protein [Desulfobotulus pelophilus]